MPTNPAGLRVPGIALLVAFVGVAPALTAQCPAMSNGELPLVFAGPPTTAQITACDLMTRLYAFANDSMGGRRVGSADHVRATDYITAEVKRLGLKPAGENGGFFQNLPLVSRAIDTTSTIVAGGVTLKAGVDFLASTSAKHPADFNGLRLVYGGTLLDTTVNLAPMIADGAIVIFRQAPQGVDLDALQRTPKGHDWVVVYNTIRNRAAANGAQWNPAAIRAAINPTQTMVLAETGANLSLTLTTSAVDQLFGGPLANVAPGTSKPLTLNLRYIDTQRTNRNIIAVIPGSDPKLKGEYVALGAHTDHVGMARAPLDHDSVRAFHLSSRGGAEGGASRKQTTEDEEYDRIHFLTDSLHKARPIRRDSIYNGANDGGSGTVALLEIAEQFAKGGLKPKRSILFVWHTSAELNPPLAGSTFFTSHPTVPLDSIVAELDVDMIGRGEVKDEVGVTKDEEPRHGNADYVEVLGSRRLSTELGALVDQANVEAKGGLHIDYIGETQGDPDGLYCRNDLSSYARYGIPSAFFTTGYYADFLQVTDEPQYIQYQHMARIVELVSATTLKVANLDHRPALDHPKPDPKVRCMDARRGEGG